jgi:hypothetical protein
MPEFQLEGASEPDFRALDSFTQGYIEALFFTSEGPGVSTREFKTKVYQKRLEEGQADGQLPGDVGFPDLAPETLARIVADCKGFQERNAALLQEAYDTDDYEAEQAGRDFWFTRNGHGVGYWDRKALEVNGIGDRLSACCGWRSNTDREADPTALYFGEIDAYFGDDDKVYLS